MRVPLQRLDPGLPGPRRVRAGDAAADLPARHDTVLPSGETVAVPTGFAIAIPPGHAGLILPRSGLAANVGVTVLNAPGLIDSGYRGELIVLLHNTSSVQAEVRRGDRIAQLLVIPIPALGFDEVDSLPPAPDDRGADGFGSSGR